MNVPNEEKMLAIKTEVDEFLYSQQEIKITSTKDYTKAGDMLKMIHNKAKQLEEKRKDYTRPLLESKKKIDTDFKSVIKPLEEFIKNVKGEMIEWKKYEQEQLDIEQKRLEAEALAKAKSEGKSEVEVDIVNEKKTERGEVSTSTIRDVWDYKIIDENKIPRMFLTPDEKTIKKAIAEGGRYIGGIEIFKKQSITIR